MVAPQVLPRMTERFSAWDPLADPAWGTADMAVWRPLLESESQRDAIFQVVHACRACLRLSESTLCRIKCSCFHDVVSSCRLAMQTALSWQVAGNAAGTAASCSERRPRCA